MSIETDQIAIFINKDGDVRVDVQSKHIPNILREEELDKSVCANFAHTGPDGNKRIGCFLFLLFLQKNKGSLLTIPSPESLTAIALLIAESDPKQKNLIIKLVINLIANGGMFSP